MMRQRKKKDGADSEAAESVKRGRAASPPPGAGEKAETKRARGRPAESEFRDQQEASSSKSEEVADVSGEPVRKNARAPRKKEAAPKAASESSNDDAKLKTDRGAAPASSAEADSSETASEKVEDLLPKKRARVPKTKQTPAASSETLPKDDDVQVSGDVKSVSSAPAKTEHSTSKASDEDLNSDSVPKKRARAAKTKTAVVVSDISPKDEVRHDTELLPGASNSEMSKIPFEDLSRDAVPKKKARAPKAKQTDEATSDTPPKEDVLDDVELESGNDIEPHATDQTSAQSSSKTSDDATNTVQKKARVTKNQKKPTDSDVNKVSEKSDLNVDTRKKKTTVSQGKFKAGDLEENEIVPDTVALGADGGDTQRNVKQMAKKGKNISTVDPYASKAQTSKPVKEQGEPSRILPKRAARGTKVNYVDSPEEMLPKPTVKPEPKPSDKVKKGKSKKIDLEVSQPNENPADALPLSNGNPKIAIEHCKS